MSKEKYHVLAIGGIGMSAIARLLKQKGYAVSGYDDVLTDLTHELQDEGIKIINSPPESIKCLVYSSAIPLNHPQIVEATKKKIKLIHRSDALSELMQGKESVLIAGTHGKTTVSGILSHALIFAGLNPSFAVGGILNNYNTNAKIGGGNFFVSESDESDGSFLKYSSDFAIITNIDNDHLEYWRSVENLRLGFQKFINHVSNGIVWCCDDEKLCNLNPKGLSYGFSSLADVKIYNYSTTKNGSIFSVQYLNKTFEKIFIPLFGDHQVLNATAVIAFFLQNKLPLKMLFKSFKTFTGIKRRQEYIGSHDYIDVYNDYAHHPTEINAILDSFRKKIEERRLVVVFQPHRFSRTETLINDFKNCFSIADVLYITEIYNAFETPVEGCIENFFQNINHQKKYLLSAENFYTTLLKDIQMHDCVLFLGAGNIDKKAALLFKELKKIKYKLKVGVLYGGVDSEHDISLKSAKFFFDNIDKKSYEVEPCYINKEFDIDLKFLSKILSCDICIPILHGKKGEDGLIQSILQGLKVPYTGCDHYASSVCMNKAWTKAICESVQISTSKYLHVTSRDWNFQQKKIIEDIKNKINLPFYVKGCHMGSTVGMVKCDDISTIEDCIKYVFSFDDELIIEKEIVGRQIEFAIWGNDFIHVGEPAEIISDGIYTYEKKYLNNLAKIPVDIDPEILDTGKNIAINAYKACCCRGLARIDFFFTKQNLFILNEINPIPGFTKTSPYFPMLKYQKITENEFINKLIILALHAHRSYA